MLLGLVFVETLSLFTFVWGSSFTSSFKFDHSSMPRLGQLPRAVSFSEEEERQEFNTHLTNGTMRA